MKPNVLTELLKTVGRELVTRRVSRVLLYRLPPYFRSAFALYEVVMFGRKLILAIPKEKRQFSIEETRRYLEQLRKRTGKRAVLMLDGITALTGARGDRGTLIPGAQYLLICHMFFRDSGRSLEERPFREIAAQTGNSVAATSRAVRNLRKFGLVHLIGGKEKQIRFKSDREELWMEAQLLGMLSDPVEKRIFTDELPGGVRMLRAGVSALQTYDPGYTGSSGPGSPDDRGYYAISRTEFDRLRKAGSLDDTEVFTGRYCLEVWNYDPAVPASAVMPGNPAVDPFSLYLSLEHTHNERIRQTLDRVVGMFLK